ncbi:unnamed protein product [Pylaiella littoralis]
MGVGGELRSPPPSTPRRVQTIRQWLRRKEAATSWRLLGEGNAGQQQRDAAVTSRSGESMGTASDVGRGRCLLWRCTLALLWTLDPRSSTAAPIYNRGKQKKVFEAAANIFLKTLGDEGQIVSLDRLGPVFDQEGQCGQHHAKYAEWSS